MRRPLLLSLVVLAVGGAFVVAEVLSGSGGATTARSAPALPTSVLVGPRITIADLRGTPAVVNFWASWCGPCIKEAPELARLQRVLGDRARLVGVDWNDSADGARKFIRRWRWTFPNLRDANGDVGNRYRITGLPTTFVLDANGAIVKRLTGPQRAVDVLRAVRTVERSQAT